MKKCWASILFFFGVSLVFAQEPTYKQITDQDGLPSNEVFNIMQDSRGFVWMGTDKGLCRYDGFRFYYYNNAEQASWPVTDIQEDNEGRLWCTNFSGQLFYVENDSHKIFKPFSGRNNGYVHFIIDNQDGKLYAATKSDYFFEYDLTGKKTVEQKLPENLEERSVSYFFDLGHNKLLCQHYLVFDNGKFRPLKTEHAAQGNMGLDIVAFKLSDKVYVYSYITDELHVLKNDSVVSLRKNFFKSLSLGTYNTISVLDKSHVALNSTQGAIVINDKLEAETEVLYKHESVSDLLRDNEGNYWISTLRSGVFFVPNLSVQLYNSKTSALPFDHITALHQYKSNLLLVGFSNGQACVFDPEKNEVLQNLPSGETRPITHFITDGAEGFYMCNANLNWYAHPNSQPQTWRLSGRKFFMDENILYTASSYSAYLFNNPAESSSAIPAAWLRHHSFLPNPKEALQLVGLRLSRANDIVYNRYNQKIYVAYSDGLFVHDTLNTVQISVNEKPLYASCLLLGKNGEVICGSNGDGIFFIDNTRVVKRLNIQNGLLDNNIQNLFLENNTLWILHKAGVDAYDLSTEKFRHYSVHDGLFPKDYFNVAVLNDKVYLSSSRGLISFPIALNDKNEIAPRVFISGFFANEKKIDPLHNQRISYAQKNIRISFYGLSYRSQKGFKYEYRLLGNNDTSWISVSPEVNELRFPSLSPGSYVFQIKALNVDGLQGKTESMSFIIQKAFWQRGWFIVLCILCLAFFTALFYQWRINEQRKKNKLEVSRIQAEAALRESEMSSLKVQMNPHFIFNALNSIQEFILTNEKKSANLYLGKFSDLMRMTLDMSQQKTVSLKDELMVLNLYLELEGLRFMNELNYTVELNNIHQTDEIRIPSMLIQPYVENAIKHGLLHKKSDKQLHIGFTFLEKEKILECTIDDNGIGRAQAAELKKYRPVQHQSFASSATGRRLELLNYGRSKAIAINITDKHDAQGNALGTRVVLQIPV